jgi:predicted transcriptional regulator of viral defense system
MTLEEFEHARDFITALQSKGRIHFTTADAQAALGSSLPATRKALRNLKSKGEIATPFQGFYVVVPPEYLSIGCLPADQFIPQLMEYLKEPYYACLLTAAAYHGAAHQAAQWFQVMVEHNRPDIVCGKVQIKFVARRDLTGVPTQNRNTLRAVLHFSTPEATALDLVGYCGQAGGLSHVATLLDDLAETIKTSALSQVIAISPTAWVQRLGYLFELLEKEKLANFLARFVAKEARYFVPLSPHLSKSGASRNAKWKLLLNDEVEPDL